MPETLGSTIRKAREATGRSLRDVARTLTITPSYLSDIENDRRIPAESVIESIAGVLVTDRVVLMAMAGRFSERAEAWMKDHPAIYAVIERLAEMDADDAVIVGISEELAR